MNQPDANADDLNFMTTRAAARQLGLAVRSVQLMVDRGELQAWRTPGGHRRIVRQSVQNWRARGEDGNAKLFGSSVGPVSSRVPSGGIAATPAPASTVLLIEDSVYFQNLVKLLMEQTFPNVKLHVAADGIVGLAMAGQLQPDVLIVDILLPSIDGATLITTLRSHPQFDRSRVLVLTSLSASQLGPYAFALTGLPVVHKSRLAAELPPLLASLFNESTVHHA